MAETTGIDWADATFNPWIGCEKVSPGCAHCYAETLVTGARMNRPGTWGEDGVRERTAASTWKKPLHWERLAASDLSPSGDPIDHRPRVFCASLADAFEPRPELEPWRRDLFDLIVRTPSLDWLLLTKRPEEARDWMRRWYEEPVRMGGGSLFRLEGDDNWHWRDGIGWATLPNVWIGTSIENARHTWRADVLREIPAAVRFISAEPLLGSLFPPDRLDRGYGVGSAEPRQPPSRDGASPSRDSGAGQVRLGSPYTSGREALDLSGIDWLIVGGESGGRESRPMHPAWARELRDHCLVEDYGGPGDVFRIGPRFFFKQWGSYAPRGFVSGKGDVDDRHQKLVAGGADPTTDWEMFYYGPGPKAGGKILDGREWCEFPERQSVPA